MTNGGHVTDKPRASISDYADYASVQWLVRRYALTILPAVSSLTSLRHFAEGRHAKSPFLGFGDPDFRGDGNERNATAGSLFRGSESILNGLDRLPALPETATLLLAEAQFLHAPMSTVHLRHDATVTRVKSLDLSDTRIIAFATHGLIAGDFPALDEPALALTPPRIPSKQDDGLLRASEVSQLKLNADWVLLSACSTAASDGSPALKGYQDLRRLFFMPEQDRYWSRIGRSKLRQPSN
jgi:CHAT domain-containing protein